MKIIYKINAKYDDLTLECLIYEKSHAVYLTGDSHAKPFSFEY